MVLPPDLDSMEEDCEASIKTPSRQQNFLGYFGPLSLIMLLAFLGYATLILGFALLQYGIGGHEQLNREPITFGRDHLSERRRPFSRWAMATFFPLPASRVPSCGDRSRHGLRLSRRCDRIYSGGVFVVFQAGDSNLDARRPRRIPADGRLSC
jgi:hypothetical protein